MDYNMDKLENEKLVYTSKGNPIITVGFCTTVLDK